MSDPLGKEEEMMANAETPDEEVIMAEEIDPKDELKKMEDEEEVDPADYYPLREFTINVFKDPISFNPLVSAIGCLCLWGLSLWCMGKCHVVRVRELVSAEGS